MLRRKVFYWEEHLANSL